jgi:hypothetical protein
MRRWGADVCDSSYRVLVQVVLTSLLTMRHQQEMVCGLQRGRAMQLGNLKLADLQGKCEQCGAHQPVDNARLLGAYGRGATLVDLPPQPCMFCNEDGVKVWAMGQ